MGREANILELKDLTYKNILKAIREKQGFIETIEVDPGYGKYHFDGHKECKVCLDPSESKKNKEVCPKCKRKLTIGVLSRVNELADREIGFKPKGAIPFKTLLPLSEVISASLGTSVSAKKTWAEYNSLIAHFGNELNILIEASEQEISKVSSEQIALMIMKNRKGLLEVSPGYDGVYGSLTSEKKQSSEQKPDFKPSQSSLTSF